MTQHQDEGRLLTGWAFWLFGGISALAWIGLIAMVWPEKVRAFLALFCWECL